MSRMHKMRVDGIEAGPHARPIEQTHVAALAQSMEALGLRMPIDVQMTNGGPAMLVTGLHRLMAARQLGWEEIEVRVLEEGELDAFDLQLWQIDENLLRRELAGPELAEHKERRQQIVEAKLSVQTLQQEWECAGEETRLTFLDWIKRQADGDGAPGGETQRVVMGWAMQQSDEQDAGQAQPAAGAPEANEPAPVETPATEIPVTEEGAASAVQDAAPAAQVDDPPPAEEQPASAGGHPLLRAVRRGAAQEPAERPARRASRFLSLGAARA